MDAPAPVHLQGKYKLIRFILSTKDFALKFELIKSVRKWVLKALSDSGFASDKETRIIVYGYIIYFCGIPIAWRSKGMKSVELSTTKAEYMALSVLILTATPLTVIRRLRLRAPTRHIGTLGRCTQNSHRT